MFKFTVIAYRLFFALLIVATVAWQFSDRAFGPGFNFVNFFSFFTILSNLFLAAMFLASAWTGRRGKLVARLRGAAVLYMMTTGIVYAVLLAPLEVNVGVTAPWVDTVLHQIMPVVALLDWLLVPPKMRLGKKTLLYWIGFPLAYLGYSLVRGHVTGWHPYPFLDPAQSGYLGIAGKCIGTAVAVLALGWFVIWTGNKLRAFALTHPHRYPHFVDSNMPAVDWQGVRKGKLIGLLLLIITAILAMGAWTGYQFWRSAQIHTEQHITTTSMPDIHQQIDVYEGRYFKALAKYPITNDTTINNNVRDVVNQQFQPCRRQAQTRRVEPLFTCMATFRILYETPNYLALMYTFKHGDTIRKQTLLYNRTEKSRMSVNDLFKADTPYVKTLGIAARAKLNARYNKLYKQDTAAHADMMQATEPAAANFQNFLLQNETFFLVYSAGQVAPESAGSLRIALDKNRLYGLLKPTVVDQFFPKFKKQKDEERRRAEDARRQAQAAEIARQHTRSLVAANRSNINCNRMKCVSLTFDDGPGPHTNQLLDILQTRETVASFFVVGPRARSDPGTLKRTVREKSEVANHSWSHANLTQLSNQHIADEVELTNSAIRNATGTYPKLMRPPYGAYNNRVIAHIGMPIAMWSVDTNDWKKPGSSAVCQRAVSGARPGAVILMHDIHADSVAAVPCIIDELQPQGYVLVTMSELFDINARNVKSYSGHVLRSR